jgi:hypothetical protein
MPTEELTKARSVIQQADKGDAQRYAENAEVDADLATARGNSGAAERAVQEIKQSMEALKQESERKGNDSGASRM